MALVGGSEWTGQGALERGGWVQAGRARRNGRAKMGAGTVDITTGLTTETKLINNEDALAQVRWARAEALLSLYKALGGGWRKAGDDQHPGLSPGRLGGAFALPIGGNVR